MSLHPISKAIRTRTQQTDEMEHSSALYLTSSFAFDNAEDMRAAFADESDANIYSRFSNPGTEEFVSRVCALEGAEEGFATASGMSAIFSTFMALMQQGDHLVSCSSVFGSTHTVISKFLPRYGISYTYVNANDTEGWERAVRPNTKMIFLETPTNPGLDIIDLVAVSDIAKKRGIILCVDNCFATPIGQRPLDLGADLVIHSATKWMDGQGRVLGGVVVGRKDLINDIYSFCRSSGPAISPFNAWVLSKSLETLDVRMERHSSNALYIAEHLQGHTKLLSLRYPFLPSHPHYAIAKKQMNNGGGIVCFELAGGLEAGKKFLDALGMLSLTANLGDTKSIASHPASTTHAKLSEQERRDVNITQGLIRISVGLEHRDDILNDILQALEKC